MCSVLHLVLVLAMAVGQVHAEVVNTDVTVNLTSTGSNSSVRLTNPSITIIDTDLEFDLNCTWENNECFSLCSRNCLFEPSNSSYQFSTQVVILNETASFPTPSCQCVVTNCSLQPIVQALQGLLDCSFSLDKIWRLFYIRGMCPSLFANNRDVKKMFINIERQLIQKLLVEPFPEASVIHNIQYIAVLMVKVSNLTSPYNTSSTDDLINISAPPLIPGNKSFIPEVAFPAEVLKNLSVENKILGLVTYSNSNQFKFSLEDIRGSVIRIEISENRKLVNLPRPIRIQFPYDSQKNLTPVCRYFEEEDWGWSSEGCETLGQNQTPGLNQAVIECGCNHTTPFAVLMVAVPIDPVHWQILSYISYVGCGLSAFFTLASILSFVFHRGPTMDISCSLHVSLSGALFVLNASFLLSEWGATLDQAWACVLIAALMHYSLLCSFSWMALEALHLYLLLIKVFNTYYTHYMAKISLVGWGVPCVIVGVSLAVRPGEKMLYGLSKMAMSGTNQTNNICWIENESFLLGVNLAYFSVVFIFSSGVLVTVSFRIFSLNRYGSNSRPGHKPGARQLPSCKDVCTVLGLSCLLGSTWGLAFLSVNNLNYPVLYLFSILNSLQGFLIFLWMMATNRKERLRSAETNSSSSIANSSTSDNQYR